MQTVVSIILSIISTFTPQTNLWGDIDMDGINESLIIEKGIAKIITQEIEIFKSDPDWNVKEILYGDFTNDGKNEFAITLWKKGNYGKAKPFWVEENDDSYRMHLFLYEIKEGKPKAKWHSSNLPTQNLLTRLVDINIDGRNELLVLEKEYNSPQINLSVWRWTGWGFELYYRIKL